MRHLILLIDMMCDDQALSPVGGDAVHEIGGSVEARRLTQAHSPWPLARVGDHLRAVMRTSHAYDYDGYGAFAHENGRFDVSERGLYQEESLGFAEIIAVSSEGEITLDTPLIDQLSSRYTGAHQSDIWIYLTRIHDHTAPGYAGRSGFTFARVMSDDQGVLMVPHFVASDIVRDNRLKPGKPWKSTHVFEAQCDQPDVYAQLIYRPYPLWLARERGWIMWDTLMTSINTSVLSIMRPSTVEGVPP